jgi:hypothetical protein
VPDSASPVAVLFSGGRDSTLAALLCHRAGSFLHLLSFDSGMGYGGELREVRIREFARVLGPASYIWHIIPNYGLVREICFAAIERDISEDGCQQILLGESLAMVARAIAYCLVHNIPTIVSGAAGYQQFYPEQQPEAMDFFGMLCAEFGLRLEAPVLTYNSEQAVKDELLMAGLSSKSLEASTILADLDRGGSASAIMPYLKRKLSITRTYLESFS